MRNHILVIAFIGVCALPHQAKCQGILADVGGKLLEKGLETCVELLVGKGMENVFGKDGPDLAALDARLRCVEGIIGANSGPLAEVRTKVSTNTTKDEYEAQIEAALVKIDDLLKSNPAEIRSLNERAEKVEQGLAAVNGRVGTLESEVGGLKVRTKRIEQVLEQIQADGAAKSGAGRLQYSKYRVVGVEEGDRLWVHESAGSESPITASIGSTARNVMLIGQPVRFEEGVWFPIKAFQAFDRVLQNDDCVMGWVNAKFLTPDE
jgi:hypothetical protein